jgi:hypothetical protein
MNKNTDPDLEVRLDRRLVTLKDLLLLFLLLLLLLLSSHSLKKSLEFRNEGKYFCP